MIRDVKALAFYRHVGEMDSSVVPVLHRPPTAPPSRGEFLGRVRLVFIKVAVATKLKGTWAALRKLTQEETVWRDYSQGNRGSGSRAGSIQNLFM